ncbi:MAG: hypothetical protein ACOY0T_35320 [Myxococcota bacterium]
MFKLWLKLSAKPWLRVQLCLAVIGAVLLLATGTYAAYRAKDSATQLGAQILNSVDVSSGEAIEFNGARFYFSANVVNDSVHSVVERAEKICDQENKDLANELTPALSRLPESALGGQKLMPSKLLTLQSEGSSSVGEVGCFRRRHGNASRFLDRVKRFAETLDFSELGSLSYVRAERYGDKTLVRTLWSEGPLSLKNVFPAEGDAPGEDLRDIPRPSGATRILSARIVGTERRVVGYDTTLPLARLNDFYASELRSSGWKELDLGAKEPINERASRAFERADRRVLLALTPSSHGTSATLVELAERR